jgi:hypothetical protein
MVPLAALLVLGSRYVLVNDDETTTPLWITSLDCSQPEPLWLQAQSVPSASLVPCGQVLPAGWRVATVKVRNGWSEFTLGHAQVGSRALVVRLSAACDTTGAIQRPSNQPGAQRYERTEPGRVATWYTVFPGGCVTAQLDPTISADAALVNQASSILGFTTRQALEQVLDERSNGRLHLDPGTAG